MAEDKERPPRSDVPIVDPTKNVLDLVEAEAHKRDEFRVVDAQLLDAKLETLRAEARVLEISLTLRDAHRAEMSRSESRRIDEQATLRADYSHQLSVAESARIDAIRAVDVNAVAVASQRASDQATVLANQVAQSAEALRTLVASTANTVAIAQQQLGTTLSTRITTLEQAQYEGKGRSAFADPAFAELLAEVKALRDSRATVSGRTEGVSSTWAILAAGALVAIGLATAIIMARQPAVQPTVSYVPAPTASPTPAPITVPR